MNDWVELKKAVSKIA